MSESYFDLKSYADANGFSVLGSEGNGQYKIKLEDGSDAIFDAKGYLAANEASDASIEYNDPQSALNDSPVTFGERLKLSLGNDKGRVEYLKKQYDDAAFTAENGLTVKKDGIWHVVDPSNFAGSGWDFAEAAKDILADNLDTAIATAGFAGAALAAPATGGASILAAGAGGAGSRAITTALGRIVGTYEATPEELAKDIMLDGIVGMAGQGIALGAKSAVIPAIKKSVSWLAEKAAPGVKQTLGRVVAAQAGIPEHNALRLFDRPKDVMGYADELLKANPKGYDANLVADGKRLVINDVEDVLRNSQKWLSGAFDKREKALIELGEGAGKIDIKQPVLNAVGKLSELGLVAPQYGVVEGNLVGFKAISPEALAKKLAPAGVDEISAKPIHRALSTWLNAAQEVADNAPKSGKEGLQQIVQLRRAFDDFYYNAVGSVGDNAQANIRSILTPISSELKEGITNQAPENARLALTEMNNFYRQMKPLAVEGQKALNSENALESFVNRLYSDPSKYVNTKDMLSSLASLHPAGDPVVNRIFDKVAASDFVRLMPKETAGPASFVSNPVRNVVGAFGAVGPRNLGRAVRSMPAAASGMNNVKNFVRSLPPSQIEELLSNPAAFNAMLATQIEYSSGEDQVTSELVRQAVANGQ